MFVYFIDSVALRRDDARPPHFPHKSNSHDDKQPHLSTPPLLPHYFLKYIEDPARSTTTLLSLHEASASLGSPLKKKPRKLG